MAMTEAAAARAPASPRRYAPAQAAGAVFAILDRVLRRAPLAGGTEPPTADEAVAAVAALRCESAAVASGLWTAHATRRAAGDAGGDAEGDAAFLAAVHGLCGGDAPLLRKEDALLTLGGGTYGALFSSAEGERLGRLEKKARTAHFYTLSSFNLFREGNEGYSKLLCLLGDGAALANSEEDAAFAEAVVEEVHALMGRFGLDVGKVCEVALAACCARVGGRGPCRLPRLFARLLDAFEPACVADMTGQLLAGNYPPAESAAGAAAGGTMGADARSRAVLQLVAVLLAERRVLLADVWAYVYPSNEGLRARHAAHAASLLELGRNKAALLPPSHEARYSATPGRGPSDRDMFAAHKICEDGPYAGLRPCESQKVVLMELLVVHGRCYDVIALEQALSGDVVGSVDLASHPPIATALCGILRIVLGPAVLAAKKEMRLEGMEPLDPAGDKQRESEAARLATLGGMDDGFIEPISSRAVLLDGDSALVSVFLSWLRLLGPHARRHFELVQDLCLLLDVPEARDNPVAEAIVQYSLLPTLVLTQSNCVLAAKIWTIISPWSHEKRWRLYRYMEEDIPAMYPIAKLLGDRASHEFKQNMKRMTIENAESLSCVVAKLSHSQPVPVINALMQHLYGYPVDDSIVMSMVSLCGNNSDLTNDVTIYVLLHRMADGNRERIKDDGLNVSQWFANSSKFLAVFIRRVSPLVEGERLQINGVVHFLMKEIGVKRNVMASVMLSDILGGVAGVPTISILSERQVLAQAGGPALIDATSGAFATVASDVAFSGKLLDSRLLKDIAAAVVSLREAFLATGMSADLGIAIGKLATHILSGDNFHLQQLKVVSKLKDRMSLLLFQYAAFLSLSVSDAGTGDASSTLGDELLAIGIAALVTDFKLPLDTTFVLLRPIVDYLQVFPSACEDPTGDRIMAPADESSSKLTLPVSDIVKQFDDARKPEDVQLLPSELLLTFWSLSDGDLHVPSEAYEAETKRLTDSITAWESAMNSEPKPRHKGEMSSRVKTLQSEVQKMKDIVKSLEAEKVSRVRRQKTVSARLALRKGKFVPSGGAGSPETAAASMRKSVSLFLQHCILPRCSLSGIDAAFCARFPVKVMTMGVHVFDMAVYFEMLLESLPNKILSSSESEAEHVAAMLRDTLETLDKWRLHKTSIPGIGFLSAKNAKQVPMDRREYLDWLRNRHERLAKAFVNVVTFQSEYLMLRNTLGALSRVMDVFPSVKEHWSLLSDCVNKLQTTSKLEDIKLFALALSARLDKRKKHVLPDYIFSMNVSEKPAGGKPVMPSQSLPPPPPPPRGDRGNGSSDGKRTSTGKRPRSPMPGDQAQASKPKALKRGDDHASQSRALPAVAAPVDSGSQAQVKTERGDRGSTGSPRDRDGKGARDQGRDVRAHPRKDRIRDEGGRGGRRDKRDAHGDGEDGRDRNVDLPRDRSERSRDRGSGRDSRPRTADRDRDRDADHPREHRDTGRDRDRERDDRGQRQDSRPDARHGMNRNASDRDLAARPRGFEAPPPPRGIPPRVNNARSGDNGDDRHQFEFRGFARNKSNKSPRDDAALHSADASAGNNRGRGRGGGSAKPGAGMGHEGGWQAGGDHRDQRQHSHSHRGGLPHDMARNGDDSYNQRQAQPPMDGRRDGPQPGPRRPPPGEMGPHGGAGGGYGGGGWGGGAPRGRPSDSHHEGNREYDGGRGGGRGGQGGGRHALNHRQHRR